MSTGKPCLLVALQAFAPIMAFMLSFKVFRAFLMMTWGKSLGLRDGTCRLASGLLFSIKPVKKASLDCDPGKPL